MFVRKYRNRKVDIDGITFDSVKESKHYLLLKALEKRGEITGLKIKPRYTLIPHFKMGNQSYRAITYTPDFEYVHKNEKVVVDVKGFKTEVYELKKKLLAYILGINVLEI